MAFTFSQEDGQKPFSRRFLKIKDNDLTTESLKICIMATEIPTQQGALCTTSSDQINHSILSLSIATFSKRISGWSRK